MGSTGKRITARRGITLAAFAMGATLILVGVEPLAAPHALPAAEAAPARTDAERTSISWDTLQPRFGDSASAAPSVRKSGLIGSVGAPQEWALAEDFTVPEGWDVTLQEDGSLDVAPPSPFTAEMVDEFDVPVTVSFADGSAGEFSAHVELANEPYLIAPGDKTYWSGRLILPLYLRAVHVPFGAKLEIDGLPDGLWTTVQAPGLKRSVYYYVNGRPQGTGEYPVTLRVVDRNGNPVENGEGPLETSFTITFRDPADLEPQDAELVEVPDTPIVAGEEVRIPVASENAASVEVSGLPEGLDFNGEERVIAGTPAAAGTSHVTVDVITEDGERLVDNFDLVVEGETAESSEPTEPTAPSEPPASSTETPAPPTTSAPSTTTPATPTAPTSPAKPPVDPVDPEGPVELDQFDWDEFEVAAGAEDAFEPARAEAGVVVYATKGAPDWVTVFRGGQVYAQPPAGTAPGIYEVPVSTSNGEDDVIRIRVVEAENDAQRYNPTYTVAYVRAGGRATSTPPRASFTVNNSAFDNQPLPAGTRFEVEGEHVSVDKHGAVTYAAPLDAPVGVAKLVHVNVIYPDGSSERTVAHFEVLKAREAEQHAPAYEEKQASVGDTVTVRQTNADLPEGADFSLDPSANLRGWDVRVDPRTGEVRATAPQDAAPLDAIVRVTYADGSEAEAPLRIGVREQASMAQGSDLHYEDAYADADGNISLKPSGDVPEGMEFTSSGASPVPVDVDEHTGEITARLPEEAAPGASFTVGVRAEFPDGSETSLDAVLSTDSEARHADITWEPFVVPTGEVAVTAKANGVPEGTTFALASSYKGMPWPAKVDESTGELTVSAPEGAQPGDSTNVLVKATFSDGSWRLLSTQATVVAAMSGAVPSDFGAAQIRPGQTATISPEFDATSFSLVEPVPGLRTRIDETTGELTVEAAAGAKPGDRNVKVRVLFADNTEAVTNATVTVLPSEGEGSADNGAAVPPAASAASSSAGVAARMVALALGIIATVGGLGFGLYHNREFFRTFLVIPLG